MKLHNFLPHLQNCVQRWASRPSRAEFENEYAKFLNPKTLGFFEDFYEVLMELDWPTYRQLVLELNPAVLEARLLGHMKAVENLLGVKLEGDVFLLGTFETIDGYARFDCGTHHVFLGMDQKFANEAARDILMVHELTHVARESRPEVWTAWGLNPLMTQAEFTDSQPTLEHLAGEGFSCLISELLVPSEPPEYYAYQTQASFDRIRRGAEFLDRAIHSEVKSTRGDYGNLYGLDPIFSHYVWAWQWMKHLYEIEFSRDAKKMVKTPSKEWLNHALAFELKGKL